MKKRTKIDVSRNKTPETLNKLRGPAGAARATRAARAAPGRNRAYTGRNSENRGVDFAAQVN
eukprot:scaffold66800_cov39-Phaeocystis_antarctica.AAC.1